MPARGIHTHRIYKLGKDRPRRDDRNLLLANILKSRLPKLPDNYDLDLAYGVPISNPMFANDELGCCVISARAHQTRRFELREQGKLLRITDADIKRQYFKETGGADEGLVLLDSLKQWRKEGWWAAGDIYKIQAFAEVSRTGGEEIRQVIFAKIGANVGVELPISAQAQIEDGKVWSVTKGPDARPRSWGGHDIVLKAWKTEGRWLLLDCITWGQEQWMTLEWWLKYCSEAYGVIDAPNKFNKRLIDARKLAGFLAGLERTI